MKFKIIAAVLLSTALTACGGGGGGDTAFVDPALDGFQSAYDALPKDANGDTDVSRLSLIPRSSIPATVTFKGGIAFSDELTPNRTIIGSMTVNANLNRNTVSGTATNFGDFEISSPIGATEIDYRTDATKVDSFTGKIVLSNGRLSGTTNITATGDMSGTLTAASDLTSYEIDGTLENAGIFNAGNGTLVFAGGVRGTVSSVAGVEDLNGLENVLIFTVD